MLQKNSSNKISLILKMDNSNNEEIITNRKGEINVWKKNIYLYLYNHNLI